MKTWKQNLPVILLIAFELAVGILLFIEPEKFTKAVIIGFGVLLLVIGLVYLIRFFADRKQLGVSLWGTLILSICSLIVGCILAFAAEFIMGLFAVLAVLYGIFLVIAGVYKGRTFFELQHLELPVSVVLLFSAILSIGLGCLLVLHPFESTVTLWRVAGISWMIEAIGDSLALVLGARK